MCTLVLNCLTPNGIGMAYLTPQFQLIDIVAHFLKMHANSVPGCFLKVLKVPGQIFWLLNVKSEVNMNNVKLYAEPIVC